MTWREQLRRVQLPDGRVVVSASFRGVPFFVEENGRSGGRRLQVDEYRGREDNDVQDLGRKARSFSVTAYVLGDDYLDARDAVITAVEAAGPGTLVLPYYRADIRALCESYQANDSRTEGGIGAISLVFREKPTLITSPIVIPELESLVESAATLTVDAVVADLDASYSVDGEPLFAQESLSTDAGAVAKAYLDQVGPVITATSGSLDQAGTAIQELANLDTQIRAIVADVASLVREPSELIDRLADAVASFAATTEAARREVFQALLLVYDTPDQPLADGDTPTRERERQNQAVLGSALRIQALMECTRSIALIEYATIDDAEADRDDLIQRIDDERQTANDNVFTALTDARAAVVRAVPGDENLARVTTVTRKIATPAVVLAYDLYGDANRDQEILDRNPDQRHPGFLVGDIEVLSA